jgi:DNA-binding response OmpR family regulator
VAADHFRANESASRGGRNRCGLILIVEDDPVLLELLTGTFIDHGWTAHGARLLVEGQRLIANLRFDVIIIDVSLPDGTGIEFIAWLRSLKRRQGGQTPCVAITGHPSLHATARAAGFHATLQKPIDIRQLVSVTAAVLAKAPAPPEP